ncbi:MAG: FRG domain-containing protein [Candidatus Scalindua sp.]|nr:FRG domain-containing protein [Candidatus Scalindua sp.]
MKKLESWEQFEERFNSYIANNLPKKSDFSPYFRGQCDAGWPLQTTLERYSPNKNYSLEEYYKILVTIKPSIEAYTSKEWKLPEFLKEKALDHPPIGYDFMVYCRHHGFPSPLLDWSKSPYVASYFAFTKAEEKKDVSIYVFMPSLKETLDDYHAEIIALGHGVESNTDRHVNQQSVYTLCRQLSYETDFYAKYTDACRNTQLSGKLTKYTIPGKEKKKVLKKLDSMDINEYSLFKGEDGLMSTLAYRHILLP